MRRLWIVLAVVALLGAACGDDEDSGSATTTTAAEAGGGITVEVDSSDSELGMAALAYFPQAITVHAGDTVTFHSNDTGEPHTVTLGTIIDSGLKAFSALPDEIKNEGPPEDPSSLPADVQKNLQDTLAMDEKLPALLPDGPGDANQLSANPCFQATGDPKTDAACAKGEQPAFDGTQTVYNSGYLADDAEFEVELADDIAPGTYSYMCLLHRQGMTGTITVVDEGTDVPSPDEVAETGAEELESRFASKLRPVAEQLNALTVDKAVAGSPPLESDPDLEASLNVFGPKELSIKAGEAVTWTVAGPHTIAIDVPQDANGAFVQAPDGTWHANAKAFAPEGGAGAPEPDPNAPPPAEDAPPVLIDGGTYSGDGYRSSGLILSFGAPVYQYKLTFAKAGTYEVVCQIHPDMKGTVKVA